METIVDCKHEDCIFRSTLPKPNGSCSYALIMGRSRECKISDCTRYISKNKVNKKTKINRFFEIVWELDEESEVEE